MVKIWYTKIILGNMHYNNEIHDIHDHFTCFPGLVILRSISCVGVGGLCWHNFEHNM